jgi:hypothetical protein
MLSSFTKSLQKDIMHKLKFKQKKVLTNRSLIRD